MFSSSAPAIPKLKFEFRVGSVSSESSRAGVAGRVGSKTSYRSSLGVEEAVGPSSKCTRRELKIREARMGSNENGGREGGDLSFFFSLSGSVFLEVDFAGLHA